MEVSDPGVRPTCTQPMHDYGRIGVNLLDGTELTAFRPSWDWSRNVRVNNPAGRTGAVGGPSTPDAPEYSDPLRRPALHPRDRQPSDHRRFTPLERPDGTRLRSKNAPARHPDEDFEPPDIGPGMVRAVRACLVHCPAGRPLGYPQSRPEDEPLHQLLREHLEMFLEHTQPSYKLARVSRSGASPPPLDAKKSHNPGLLRPISGSWNAESRR